MAKARIDLSWLGQQNTKEQPHKEHPYTEPPTPEEEIVEEKKPVPKETPPKEEHHDDSGIVMGREDEETFVKNEKKFDGPNADILSAPTPSTYMQNRMMEKKQEKHEEPLIAPEPQQQIRVFLLGGNDKYYRNTLEPLNSSTGDIKFVKQMPSDDDIALQAIEAVDPDIVIVWARAGMADPLRFWRTINDGFDTNGKRLIEPYLHRNVIAIIPNDISTEIEMQGAGLSWFVRETNPQRHEINIDTMIETIREAYRDILNRAPVPSQEDAPQEEPIVKEEHVEEPTEQHRQAEEPQKAVVTPPRAEEKPVVQATPRKEAKEEPQPEEEVVAPRPVEEPKQHVDTRTLSERMQERTMPSNPNAPAKIIGMYSVTGGAGTTTCAVNLASILAKYSNNEVNSDYRVLLLEYNLSCQCIDIFFGIKTEGKTIFELAKDTEEYKNDRDEVIVDSERMKPLISKYVTRDDKTGLDILFGISVPLELDNIHKGFTKSLFGALRRMYDVVIVDLNADMAKEPILDALEEIDTLYYIMPMDVASIRNTQQIIPILKSVFGLTAEKVKIIVNKVIENNHEFDVGQIENLFAKMDYAVEGTIPYEEAELVSALNRGIPIAIENPDHPVAQALHSFAVEINPMIDVSAVGDNEEKPKKKGFFAGLFGGKKKKKAEKNKEKKHKSSMFHGKSKKQEEETEEEVTEIREEEEEKPKKKGFFAGLFGGKKKKKKKIPPKKVVEEEPEEEEIEEIPTAEDEEEEVVEAPKKKKRQSLFARLAGMLSFGKKKVNVKKNSRVGILNGRKNEEEEPEEEEPRPRLVARRRRAIRR